MRILYDTIGDVAIELVTAAGTWTLISGLVFVRAVIV